MYIRRLFFDGMGTKTVLLIGLLNNVRKTSVLVIIV